MVLMDSIALVVQVLVLQVVNTDLVGNMVREGNIVPEVEVIKDQADNLVLEVGLIEVRVDNSVLEVQQVNMVLAVELVKDRVDNTGMAVGLVKDRVDNTVLVVQEGKADSFLCKLEEVINGLQ